MNNIDRKQGFANSPTDVRFEYEGQVIGFRSVGENDNILGNMLRRSTFYEVDVLERIRERVKARANAAVIDAGAFIGTHSTYFAKFCGLRPVIAFEPNPNAFLLLKYNIASNQLSETVIAIRKALGASPGYAVVDCAQADNQGGCTVSFISEERQDSVEVSTLRGGSGFSDTGISGFRTGRQRDRRYEVYEEAQTEPRSGVQGAGGLGGDPG